MPGGSVNGRPFRESSDSYQRTGIPCGNPKRFHSHEVLRVEPGHRTGSSCIDGPLEEIETAGQKHLQTLLQKQMDSKIPLQQYINQKKEFSRGAEYDPISKETSGTLTLDDFKVLEQTDSYIEELKACGLTSEEILYKLQAEDTEPNAKKGKFTNADHEQTRVLEIERKIEEKRAGLEKPDTFSNVKKLSRHELDLEKALSAGNQTNTFLHKMLIQGRDKTAGTTSSNVMSQLPEILDSVTNVEKCSMPKRKQSRRKLKHDKYKSDCTLECCVQNNCISCDEIISLCSCKTESSHLDINQEPAPTCAERPDGFVSQLDLENGQEDGTQNKISSNQSKDKRSTSFCVIKSYINSCGKLASTDNKSYEYVNKETSDGRTTNQKHDSGFESKERKVTSDNRVIETEDLQILNDVAGIPEDVILQYKLSNEQVKKIPRFENYTPGDPSNVLYVKNLSPKLTEEELAAPFINFQKNNTDKIVFKLLTGRMKGQAFVTFPDTETANEALQLVHGYQYKGKPVILQYGKKNTM